MNEIKNILLLVVILFSSDYISANDNLNGTRIYCETTSCGFFEDNCKEQKLKFFLGYEFNKDNVMESYYRPITKKILRPNRNLFYATTVNEIYLSPKKLSIDALRSTYEKVVVIDRDNLSMRYRHDYIDRTPFSCKVFNGTKGEFQYLLERLHNDEIKKQTQDNKI